MSLAAIGQTIVVMLLWASCFPLITIGIDYAPHLTFAALRAEIAGASLIGLAVLLGKPRPRGARNWLMLGIVGFGATSLGYFGMFHAAEFVSPGIATVIANTQPLLAAALAALLLDERLSIRKALGLALGFAGILAIAAPQLTSSAGNAYAFGFALIIMAALGVTISNVTIKKIAGGIDPLFAMGIQMLVGGWPLVLIAGLTEEPINIVWTWEFIAALLLLSLLGSALVYWLWFKILEDVPLTSANAFSFLIPMFGMLIGALFFGETFGWVELVGITLTLVGIGLVASPHSEEPRRRPAESEFCRERRK
ncbi:MAG: DMT family transporter [Pseudomonadota bacterium]